MLPAVSPPGLPKYNDAKWDPVFARGAELGIVFVMHTGTGLESVVIALLGATLGVVLGVVFGMAIQRALADEGFSTLQIPWVQLVAFVLMAGIVGVLAAVWPGRRAAKLKILDAIGSE